MGLLNIMRLGNQASKVSALLEDDIGLSVKRGDDIYHSIMGVVHSGHGKINTHDMATTVLVDLLSQCTDLSLARKLSLGWINKINNSNWRGKVGPIGNGGILEIEDYQR